MNKSWLFIMAFVLFSSPTILAKEYNDLDFEQASLETLQELEKNLQNIQKSDNASLYTYHQLLFQHRKVTNKDIENKTFQKYLKNYYKYHAVFQESYDKTYLLRHGVLIKQAWQDYITFTLTLSPAEYAYTAKIRADITKFYLQWQQHRSFLGGGTKEESDKHRLRHFGFFYFFSKLSEFYENFYQQTPDLFNLYKDKQYALYARKPSSFFRDGKRASGKIAGGVGYLAGLTAVALPTLADLFVPTKSGSLFIPLSQKIDFILNREASLRGIKTSYYNRSNLPNFAHAGEKDLFLLLPDHHLGLADAALIAGLKLPNYMIFAKAKEFAPKFLAQKLADHPQFIAVGTKSSDGHGSVEQLENALINRQSNIVINFPQGHLEPNQTMPINGAFSQSLLKHFMDKGYALHIVPIKFHSPSPFPYDSTSLPSNFPINRVAGEVLPELPPALLQIIIEREFRVKKETVPYANFFAILLRSIWIQKNTIFPDLSTEEMLGRVALMRPR